GKHRIGRMQPGEPCADLLRPLSSRLPALLIPAGNGKTDGRGPGYGYRPAGGATRLTSITSSPRLLIRSIRPDRAPRSGSSARRVVVPGPMVTSQSSNSALSVVPACPRNVISYVFDC